MTPVWPKKMVQNHLKWVRFGKFDLDPKTFDLDPNKFDLDSIRWCKTFDLAQGKNNPAPKEFFWRFFFGWKKFDSIQKFRLKSSMGCKSSTSIQKSSTSIRIDLEPAFEQGQPCGCVWESWQISERWLFFQQQLRLSELHKTTGQHQQAHSLYEALSANEQHSRHRLNRRRALLLSKTGSVAFSVCPVCNCTVKGNFFTRVIKKTGAGGARENFLRFSKSVKALEKGCQTSKAANGSIEFNSIGTVQSSIQFNRKTPVQFNSIQYWTLSFVRFLSTFLSKASQNSIVNFNVVEWGDWPEQLSKRMLFFRL